jgi:hypothetical protein
MPEKEKNSKRLTSSLYLCTVEILRELKSVRNSSVVLAEVCGCTNLPAVFVLMDSMNFGVMLSMSIFPFAMRLRNLSLSELFHLAVHSVVPVALGIV